MQGVYIIFAGCCLNCCVFGALMRPLELVIQRPCHSKHNLSLELPDGSRSTTKRGSGSSQQHNAPGGATGPGALGLPKIPSLLMTPGNSLRYVYSTWLFLHSNTHTYLLTVNAKQDCSFSSGYSLLSEEIVEEPEDDDDGMFEEDDGGPSMLTQASRAAALRRKTIHDPSNSPALMDKHNRFLAPQKPPRRNVSTPGFGKLTKITGLDGPPEARHDHVIFGVNEGSKMTLEPSRRDSATAAIVRPMSRKDIFFSGSIFHLVEETPTMRIENRLDKYRHSVISIPKGQ